MREETVLLLLQVLPFVTAGLILCLVLLLTRQYSSPLILQSYREFTGLLKERNSNSNWYQRTEAWLRRSGGSYHYGKWITPITYLTMRILAAVAGAIGGAAIAPCWGVLAAMVLFWLPGGMLGWLNRNDNIRLLPELKLVYHALEIQIRAGVYVTDALAECYGSVREKRLRAALLDLAGDIVMKADIYEALERFQGKFENPYVDSLCITILQALESGQAVELLGDISEQIKDMESRVLERRKAALDRKITFYQLGILAAVLGVVLYACVTHMYTAAIRF